MKNKTKESKALWLFISLATSLVIIAIILFNLAEWKSELHKPPKPEQVAVAQQEVMVGSALTPVHYPEGNALLKELHPALAGKKEVLITITENIDNIISRIRSLQQSHPNHQEYLSSIIVLYVQEKTKIIQIINKISIRSQNAASQVGTTQKSNLVKSAFQNECNILLKEASTFDQHLKTRLSNVIAKLVNKELKFSREQLARQQRERPTLPATLEAAKFSDTSIITLQDYAKRLGLTVGQQMKTLSDEIMDDQRRMVTLYNLISTEENHELKAPLRRALKAWTLTEIKAYQRWEELLYALESSYLAYNLNQMRSIEYTHLTQQIKAASQQFINEVQKSNQETSQQYYSLEEPKKPESKAHLELKIE